MKSCVPSLILASAAGLLAVSVAAAQAPAPPAPGASPMQRIFPAEMKNRKVLPPGTGGAKLVQTMKGFSLALGVRCTFCHAGTEDIPLPQRDFASDANPHKATARAMITLVARLNREDLPAVPGIKDPVVTCYTCHRGAERPLIEPPPGATVSPPAAAPAPPK